MKCGGLVFLLGCALLAECSFNWMSFWTLDTADDLTANVTLGNFIFDSSSDDFILQAHKNGLYVLYDVEPLLYTTTSDGHYVLRDDYIQQWASAVSSKFRAWYDDGTIVGFFMGDELTWGGLPYADLVKTVDLVAGDFPSAIIYYNEAWLPFVYDVDIWSEPIGYENIPANLTWVSMDYYPDSGSIKDAQNIYTNYIYTRMSDNQRALFVPPCYGTVNDPVRYCGSSDCNAAMIDWAWNSYDWISADDRMIGLNPWHWHCYDSGPESHYENGAACMDDVRSNWEQITAKLVPPAL
ncbi:hypothetical protein Pelo_4102 [Pelomyxa schiedti]|nr:hypothetical protein Pelo_4102 [Pelomyxa schiedti]